jgi:hypothetical protein
VAEFFTWCQEYCSEQLAAPATALLDQGIDLEGSGVGDDWEQAGTHDAAAAAGQLPPQQGGEAAWADDASPAGTAQLQPGGGAARAPAPDLPGAGSPRGEGGAGQQQRKRAKRGQAAAGAGGRQQPQGRGGGRQLEAARTQGSSVASMSDLEEQFFDAEEGGSGGGWVVGPGRLLAWGWAAGSTRRRCPLSECLPAPAAAAVWPAGLSPGINSCWFEGGWPAWAMHAGHLTAAT